MGGSSEFDQKTRLSSMHSVLVKNNGVYHNGLKTEAHLISIKHEDPAFAAFLVNEIINYFSKASRQEKIEKKIETLDYLSRALAKAEIEKNERIGQRENLLIEKNLPSPKNIAQQNGTSLTTLKNTAFFDLKKQSELLKDALSFIEENIASLNLREVSDFWHSIRLFLHTCVRSNRNRKIRFELNDLQISVQDL